MVPGPREEAGNEVGLDVQVREVASRYITSQLIEVRLKFCKACEGVCGRTIVTELLKYYRSGSGLVMRWEWSEHGVN